MVLAGLVAGAGAALAGCTGTSDRDAARRGRDRATAQATVPAPLTADERLLAAALDAVATATAVLDRTAAEHRVLRPLLASARSAHEEHRRVLAQAGREASTSGPPRPGVPGDPASALAGCARAEADASRTLARQVLTAESGALARALASIAASCGQRAVALRQAVADLPDGRAGGRGRDDGVRP